MTHLTAHQMSDYLHRELPGWSAELIRRHLAECTACAERFAEFRDQEATLGRVGVVKAPHEPQGHAAPRAPRDRRRPAGGWLAAFLLG